MLYMQFFEILRWNMLSGLQDKKKIDKWVKYLFFVCLL